MAFQRWLEDGPGGVKGTVTRVHGGEIARAELVPPSAIVPQRLTDVLAMLSGELHDNSAISQS
jgi:hypothetical protein